MVPYFCPVSWFFADSFMGHLRTVTETFRVLSYKGKNPLTVPYLSELLVPLKLIRGRWHDEEEREGLSVQDPQNLVFDFQPPFTSGVASAKCNIHKPQLSFLCEQTIMQTLCKALINSQNYFCKTHIILFSIK